MDPSSPDQPLPQPSAVRVDRLRSIDFTVAIGAGLLLAALFLALDALAVRAALEGVDASLTAAKARVAEADVGGAQAPVDEARRLVAGARTRSDGLLWTLAAAPPWLGDGAEVVTRAVDLADAVVSLAEAALERGDELMPSGGGLPVTFQDGRLDLDELGLVGDVLADLPVASIGQARDGLDRAAAGFVPGFVRSSARQAVAAADRVLALLASGREGVTLLEGLLGAEQPRTILIGVQNPGELRGTGGLLGFLGILRTASGEVTLEEPIGFDPRALADEARRGAAGAEGVGVAHRGALDRHDLLGDPVDRPADFAARYDRVHGGSSLTAVNLYPDVAVIGPVLAGIYTKLTEVPVDALVLVDPIALERLQHAIGPLDVPDDVAALVPSLPDPIPPDRVAATLMIDAYDELGGASDARRNYQAIVADEVISGLLAGDWETTEVARAIADALAGRHLQVWSSMAAEQQIIERLGIAGRLDDGNPLIDDVLITASNSAANKADSFVAHHFDVAVQLGVVRDGRVNRGISLTVGQVNGFTEESRHDPYLTSSLLPPRDGIAAPDARHGVMRTWWTYWLPEEDRVADIWHGQPDEPVTWKADDIQGFSAIDQLVELLPGESRLMGVEYRGWAEIEERSDGVVYRWRWRRQPKAIRDHVTVRFTPPPGWRLVDVHAAGGPHLPSLDGVDPLDPAVTRDGSSVRVTAVVTSDVVVEMVLRP